MAKKSCDSGHYKSLADWISPDNARVGGKTVDELLADGSLLPASDPRRKSVDEAIADLDRPQPFENPDE